MAAPILSGTDPASQWLICTLKQGRGLKPLVPGMSDDVTTIAISVDHIVAVTDFISAGGDGDRVRDGVSLLLQTGDWLTVQGVRGQVATLLGIA